MAFDPDPIGVDILADLAVHADPERAMGAKRYLKSDREFLGVTVPVLRKVVRANLLRYEVVDRHEVIALAAQCWEGPYFEVRHAAVEILLARASTLTIVDLALLESMLRDGETWAIVDALATKVVGTIVRQDPVGASDTLDRWAGDPQSFWLRRSAMLALLEDLRAGQGDWARFTRYADAMMGDKEFFIRKAIGWILRDTSKMRPDMVWEWAEPRVEAMSGVTKREAFRHLGGAPIARGDVS